MKLEQDTVFIPTIKAWLEGLDFQVTELIDNTLVIAVRNAGENYIRVDANDNHSFAGGKKRNISISLSKGNLSAKNTLTTDEDHTTVQSAEFLMPYEWNTTFPIAVAYLSALLDI